MKSILCIVVCSSSLLFSAASSSSQSGQEGGATDGAMRLRSVSAMGSSRELSKKKPHLHLKLGASCGGSAQHRRRSKSGGAGGMSPSKSHDSISSLPSPRGASCLQRVASFKSIQDRLDREKQKLQEFEAQLMPHEKPLYAVLGRDDLIFVQKKSNLLDRLVQMLNQGYTHEQVLHTYTAYLRCQIARLSQASEDLDDSPRLHDVPGGLDEVRAQVDKRLDEVQKAVLGTLETIAPIVETAVVVDEKE